MSVPVVVVNIRLTWIRRECQAAFIHEHFVWFLCHGRGTLLATLEDGCCLPCNQYNQCKSSQVIVKMQVGL